MKWKIAIKYCKNEFKKEKKVLLTDIHFFPPIYLLSAIRHVTKTQKNGLIIAAWCIQKTWLIVALKISFLARRLLLHFMIPDAVISCFSFQSLLLRNHLFILVLLLLFSPLLFTIKTSLFLQSSRYSRFSHSPYLIH